MSTVTVPSNRTRVNFAHSAKGEWRVAEITIELTDHEDPDIELSVLFGAVRRTAEREVYELNFPDTIDNVHF